MPKRPRGDPPYLSISEAAVLKRLSRMALHKHVQRGAFTLTTIAGRRVIVNDARFQRWDPDRERQRKTLRGLRARRKRLQRG